MIKLAVVTFIINIVTWHKSVPARRSEGVKKAASFLPGTAHVRIAGRKLSRWKCHGVMCDLQERCVEGQTLPSPGEREEACSACTPDSTRRWKCHRRPFHTANCQHLKRPLKRFALWSMWDAVIHTRTHTLQVITLVPPQHCEVCISSVPSCASRKQRLQRGRGPPRFLPISPSRAPPWIPAGTGGRLHREEPPGPAAVSGVTRHPDLLQM